MTECARYEVRATDLQDPGHTVEGSFLLLRSAISEARGLSDPLLLVWVVGLDEDGNEVETWNQVGNTTAFECRS